MEITKEERKRIHDLLLSKPVESWRRRGGEKNTAIDEACSLCSGECLGTCEENCRSTAGGIPEVAEREYYNGGWCSLPDCDEGCGSSCASGCTEGCGHGCGSACQESCSTRCGEACQFSCEGACGQVCESNPSKNNERAEVKRIPIIV